MALHRHRPPVRAATKRQGQMMSKAADKLRKAGRGNDTILAHISPAEARTLRRMGGKGTKNPVTGLPEFGHVTALRQRGSE